MILTSLSKRFVSAAVLGLILAASACQNDTLNRPFTNVPVDRLFERYVAMGNSITAGFQSAGINDSTQSRSYAVLLAQSMHSPFFSPLFSVVTCAVLSSVFDSLFSARACAFFAASRAAVSIERRRSNWLPVASAT